MTDQRSGKPKFIPCANGCGRPAREVGQPADCPDCRKTLCEWCCDARKERQPTHPDHKPMLCANPTSPHDERHGPRWCQCTCPECLRGIDDETAICICPAGCECDDHPAPVSEDVDAAMVKAQNEQEARLAALREYDDAAAALLDLDE